MLFLVMDQLLVQHLLVIWMWTRSMRNSSPFVLGEEKWLLSVLLIHTTFMQVSIRTRTLHHWEVIQFGASIAYFLLSQSKQIVLLNHEATMLWLCCKLITTYNIIWLDQGECNIYSNVHSIKAVSWMPMIKQISMTIIFLRNLWLFSLRW